MNISDITPANLQDEIIAPIFLKVYREQVTKRMKDDKYMPILVMYIDSILQKFENFLRTENDLVEDDFRLVLDENNSNFDTCESELGIYTFKDLSEALFNILQPE